MSVSKKNCVMVASDVVMNDHLQELQYGQELIRYGLLPLVLSHLDVLDLYTASKVCRHWRGTVVRLINKKFVIRWNMNHNSEKMILHRIVNKPPPESEIIIGFSLKTYKGVRSNNSASNNEDITWCPPVTRLIAPYYADNGVMKHARTNRAVLYFTKMYGLRTEVYLAKHNDRPSINPEIISRLTSSDDALKGLIIFSGVYKDDEVDVNTYMHTGKLEDIPMAGGRFECRRSSNTIIDKKRYTNTAFIAIRGDNVRCVSDILLGVTRTHMTTFMRNLSKHAGPYSQITHQRIAILFRCISRQHAKMEDNLFKEHFPNVPLFTIATNGEYAHVALGDDPEYDGQTPAKKSRERCNQCYHIYVSAYLVITVKK